MNKFHWTDEYCSYSYLRVKNRYYVCIQRCDEYNWSEGTILNMNSNEPFSKPVYKETFHGGNCYERMKKELQKRAEALYIV